MVDPKDLTGRARTSYIKRELKKAFPRTKFSVTTDNYSMGSSIHVDWEDGPTEDLVRKVGLHKLYENKYGRYFFYSRKYSQRALLLSRFAAAQIIDHEMEKHGPGWTLQKINEKAWQVFRNTNLYGTDIKELRDPKIKITRGLIDGMAFHLEEAH